jgi:hypothetical protein
MMNMLELNKTTLNEFQCQSSKFGKLFLKGTVCVIMKDADVQNLNKHNHGSPYAGETTAD